MAILSNGCVKCACSHAYASVKPPTVKGEKDAWCGTEVPAALSEPFHLTLGSKSLQINVSPPRTGSSQHYGQHRDPSAGAGATHTFHSAEKRCPLASSGAEISECLPSPPASRAQHSQAAPSAVALPLSEPSPGTLVPGKVRTERGTF